MSRHESTASGPSSATPVAKSCASCGTAQDTTASSAVRRHSPRTAPARAARSRTTPRSCRCRARRAATRRHTPPTGGRRRTRSTRSSPHDVSVTANRCPPGGLGCARGQVGHRVVPAADRATPLVVVRGVAGRSGRGEQQERDDLAAVRARAVADPDGGLRQHGEGRPRAVRVRLRVRRVGDAVAGLWCAKPARGNAAPLTRSPPSRALTTVATRTASRSTTPSRRPAVPLPPADGVRAGRRVGVVTGLRARTARVDRRALRGCRSPARARSR